MSKVWLVAVNEYRRNVFTRDFIVAILALPLMLAFTFGLGVLIERLENPAAPIGYVDQSGLLDDPLLPPQRGSSPSNPSVAPVLPMIAYPTAEKAEQALRAGEIQAYYVVSADYLSSRRVTMMYITPPGDSVYGQFWDFLQINQLTGLPPEIARRAVAGSNLIVRWPEDAPGGGREFSQRTFLSVFLPLAVAIGFVFLLMITSSAFVEIVQREKQNRTMEIILSSISPEQLIVGKVLGVVGVVAAELAIWTAAVALVVVIGKRLQVAALQNLVVEGRLLLQLMVIAVPSYVLAAALMTALGAVVAESQEAQSVSFLVTVPFIAPFWLAPLIIEGTSNILPVIFSLFPLTTLSTMSLRLMWDQVPDWQFFLAAGLTTVAAAAAVWLAAYLFRLGMLRYGHVRWQELFARPAKEGAQHA